LPNSTVSASSHKLGDDVELYTGSGGRFSGRNPVLVDMLRELPVRSAIIEGEIVASDAAGVPDIWRLLFLRLEKPAQLHIWAFDLLALNRKDLRKWSLD
jgi:ATP-dependent DNA ligase